MTAASVAAAAAAGRADVAVAAFLAEMRVVVHGSLQRIRIPAHVPTRQLATFHGCTGVVAQPPSKATTINTITARSVLPSKKSFGIAVSDQVDDFLAQRYPRPAV